MPDELEWTAGVYDGEVVSDAEAARLSALLYGRLRTLDDRLAGREFLVGDAFSIADASVLPRVAMYPWVGLGIDAGESPSRPTTSTCWSKPICRRRSRAEYKDSRSVPRRPSTGRLDATGGFGEIDFMRARSRRRAR